MLTFFVILLSVLCGIFYRLGGAGPEIADKFPSWLRWLFHPKARDVGCSIINLLTFLIIGITGEWWMWLLTLGLSIGAMTTYHKWLNKLFGYPKEDAIWLNWLITGFCYALASIPFIFGGSIILSKFIARAIITALFIMLWSVAIDEVNTEEFGRGFIYNIYTLILV